MSYGTPPGTEGESTGGFPQGSGGPGGYEGQTVPPEQYGGAPGQQAPAPGQPYGGAPGQYGAPGPYGGAPGYGAPGYGAPGPYGTPPPAYRAWAITAAVFGVLFNLILGFPAALIASRHGRRVRAQWEAGDQQGAIKSSRRARTWAIVATVLDALGVILLVLIIAAGVSSQSDYHNPSVVAASIKTLLQKRISDPSSPYYSPGLTVTSVVCTSSGTNTDSCVDHFSNGQSASETAVISANGQHFVTR